MPIIVVEQNNHDRPNIIVRISQIANRTIIINWEQYVNHYNRSIKDKNNYFTNLIKFNYQIEIKQFNGDARYSANKKHQRITMSHKSNMSILSTIFPLLTIFFNKSYFIRYSILNERWPCSFRVACFRKCFRTTNPFIEPSNEPVAVFERLR